MHAANGSNDLSDNVNAQSTDDLLPHIAGTPMPPNFVEWISVAHNDLCDSVNAQSTDDLLPQMVWKLTGATQVCEKMGATNRGSTKNK